MTDAPPDPPTPARDARLIDLLSALGAADPERLRAGLAELQAARARGEQVDAARFLAERRVVPDAVLEQLLAQVEESADARRRRPSGHAAQRPPARDEREAGGPARARPTRSPSGRAEVEPARSARAPRSPDGALPTGRRASGDAPKPARPPDEARAAKPRSARAPASPVSESGGARDAGRAAPPPAAAVGSTSEPAWPEGEEEPAAGPKLVLDLPDELTPLVPGEDLETRRYDAAALAAASARSPRRVMLAPAIVGAALVVVCAGLALALRGDPAPTPPPALPTPVDLTAPDEEDPPPEAAPGDGPRAPAPSALIPGADVAPEVSAADAWTELAGRLGALEASERYEDALAAVERAQSGHEPEARSAVARLRELVAFRTAAEAALAEAATLRERGRLDEAADRLGRLLEAHPTQVDTPPGRRVAEAQAALVEARAEREDGETPASSRRAEPPARAAAFEALASRGRTLVQALQTRIRRDQARLGEARRAELARAREATTRKPLDIELVPGFRVRAAIVDSMDEEGFTLRTKGTDELIVRTWEQVEPEVALEVRTAGVRPDSGEDHLRLGRWCLQHHLFDEARQAFNKAVQQDPRLMDQVPDMTGVARVSRLFRGKLELSGSTIDLEYGFERGGEAADWHDEAGARGVMREGRIEVRGKGVYLSGLDEIGVASRVELEVTFGPAARDTTAVAGVVFAPGTRDEDAFLVGVARPAGDLVLFRRQGGRTRVIERKAGLLRGGGDDKVTLTIEEDKLKVRAERRTQVRCDVQVPWGSARIVVGGMSQADGAASVDALSLQATLRPDWLRKATGDVDAVLRAALARSAELPVFSQPQGRPAGEELTAEDEWALDGLPSDALEAYRAARIKAASGEAADRLAAARAFDRAIELAPGFGAARYRRAHLLEQLGRTTLAIADLERAAAAVPHFHEAVSYRAHLLVRAGRLEDARAAADEAAAIRPDSARAVSARGLVRFAEGELEGAQEDLDLALALDPWDDEVRAWRRNVTHVRRGPPWARTFRVETAHYIVETDISQARCEEYARDLEAVRRFYAERFAIEEGGTVARRSKVLIFDAREGFHAYAELTTDDRVESLLGYYLPRYRQLLLYEDKDDATLEDTRRVLFHEAFHQFIHGLVADMPYWLNEGLAEYFSTLRADASGRLGGSGARLDGRLADLRRFVESGQGPIAFPRLMLETPTEFYSGPVAAKYAQAWSMVHFLAHGQSNELRERLRRYLAALRDGATSRKAFNAAWQGVDWNLLQQAWWQHVRAM